MKENVCGRIVGICCSVFLKNIYSSRLVDVVVQMAMVVAKKDAAKNELLELLHCCVCKTGVEEKAKD